MSSPLAITRHSWLALPLQLRRMIRVPFAVPPPVTPMQKLLVPLWMLPSASSVQTCAPVPLHS